MTSRGSLVVVGSGPGIGSHVAATFAANGFTKIALLARNQTQLDKDRASVEKAAVAQGSLTVKTYAVDITDLTKLKTTLEKVRVELGSPECIFFNAARVQLSTLLDTDEEEIIYDFKIAATSMHATAKWAIPQLVQLAESNPSSKPSFLVTSSHLPRNPEPPVFILSLAKAAQRNLAESMAQVYGPQGVHVGLVVVTGAVAPENQELSPKNIANKTWALFDQPRDQQELEVVIRES